MFNFLNIRKSVDDLAAQLRGLTDEIESLKRQREDIEGAPLQPSDVVARLHKSVDTAAAVGAKNFTGLKWLATTPHAPDPGELLPFLTIVEGGSYNPTTIPTANMAYLFGDLLKTELARVVTEMEWPGEPGLPLAERLRKIAAIDAQIGKTERELKELRDLADGAGLRLTRFDAPDRPEKYAGGRPDGDGAAIASKKP